MVGRRRRAVLAAAGLATMLAATAGCARQDLLIGTGTRATVALVEDRRVEDVSSDTSIQLRINRRWAEADPRFLAWLDTAINHGQVLVAGTVPDDTARYTALRLVSQVTGVRRVINAIEVDPQSGIDDYAGDAWITAQVRARLMLDPSLTARSVNYTVDTVQGIVYLMGNAQTADELSRVMRQARAVPEVRRVVSYVDIADAP